MPTRALVFLVGYGAFIIAALVFPPAGVWGYLFEWYNHPPQHWWGKNISHLFGGRWSFVIGAAMGAGLILRYRRYTQSPFLRHPQTKFILLYTINAFVVTVWSYSTEPSYGVAVEHLKMLVVYWCIVKTQSNPKYLHVTLMVCILGIVLWGYDVLTGSLTGRRLNIGAPALSDENFVAAHVVAFLPLVTWYALTEKGWVRWVCLLGAPLMVNIVAHSQSRGAVLAMGVAVMSTVLVSRRKMRAWAVAGTFVGALVALQLFNEQVFERLDTLATYQEDKSASGRIDAWRVAWQLTLRNPFGYGGEAFDVGLARPYMPSRFSTTHSMVFEVMVAWGVQGVFFIFGFILFSVRDAWRLYKASWDGVTWPPPRSTVIAVSVLTGLLSMLVAALFLNRYRWDLWWVFGGVIVCLKNIRAGEQAKATQQSQLESDEKAMIAPLVPSLRKPPAPGPQPPP